MSSNAGGPTSKQLEILRKLAAREAARRQAESQAQSSATTSVGPIAFATTTAARATTVTTIEPRNDDQADASILDVRTLEQIVKEEKSKNDVAWAKVREQHEQLAERPGEYGEAIEAGQETGASRAKEVELAMLEFEIAALSERLGKLDTPYSDAVAAILVRAKVASAIDQYITAVQDLEKELDVQRAREDEDEELIYDLSEVLIGLERRKSVLEARRQTDDLASVERKLLARVDGVENDLSRLLRSLIDITNRLFVDDEGVQQAQLRHLIDQLINKAWDTPADPYVNVAEDYIPTISAFLLRANVAVEHPRDARRIRLIDFHRPALG